VRERERERKRLGKIQVMEGKRREGMEWIGTWDGRGKRGTDGG
jgi:hypothetical protein